MKKTVKHALNVHPLLKPFTTPFYYKFDSKKCGHILTHDHMKGKGLFSLKPFLFHFLFPFFPSFPSLGGYQCP